MKKKDIFTLGILLLVCILPSSAQQKIVETQYFKNNPTLGGDVTINNSTKEIIGDKSFTTFEINAPASGSYNLNMWLLPSQLTDGTISSYDVRVNGIQIKTKVAPTTGNIQSYGLKEKVILKTGKNTIAFIAKAPEVPEIEFIRLSPNASKVFISSEKFDKYMAEIKTASARNAQMKTPIYNPGGWEVSPKDSLNFTIGYLLGTIPLYSYGYQIGIPVVYTYYRTINLTAGQSFFIATDGINNFGHILELFNSTDPETYSWSANSNSSNLASLNITIPVTGLYYVKVRSNRNARLGYVNININGQYYYNSVPAYSNGKVYSQDTEREYNTFTANSTNDPYIWVEKYGTNKLIVAFNDDWTRVSDYSWGRNSRIKKFYRYGTDAVLVSAYGSSNPNGKCDLYIGCRNSTIHPYFENLKPDDAIMSAPATAQYNCIAWAGGIVDFWEWPNVPFSEYYQQSLLAAFDAYYGSYRYPGCTLYSRSGATEANSYIDLWAIVDGTNREYTHASVAGNANGHNHGFAWESKPGSLMRTFHPRYALRGRLYGQVVEYYRPIAVAQPYSLAEAISDGRAVLETVKFSDLEKAVVKAEIDNMAISEKNMFETKYTAWKATWENSPYSNPYKFENSQYTDLLNYCRTHPDLNYLIYNKLGEGDFLNMLLVDKLTLTNSVANNQMLNNIKISNNNNKTTSTGAAIVRSPYSNSMLYVKNLLSAGIRNISSKKSIDGDGETTGISYSNTDEITARSIGSDVIINFTLSKNVNVCVSILNLSGIEIHSIINKNFTSGEYSYTTNMDKPGIYLVRVVINGNVNIKKVTIK